MVDPNRDLLELNQRLLDSIAEADWETYAQLCEPGLTAFEPEARGHLVAGLDFHRFYFEAGPPAGRRQSTMSSPHVRIMGDVAVVCYVRLTQAQAGGQPAATTACEETRIWHRRDGRWRHVHFHRSTNA